MIKELFLARRLKQFKRVKLDPHWDKLLRYCAGNGSYEGCPLPSPEKHTVPHQYGTYNGQADVPNQYSSEAEWGDQVPQQYNNEAEWDGTGQYQYSNEVPKHYSDDVGWYSNEAEWNEVPKHYSNEVEREEKGHYPYSNEGEWGGEVGKQYSHEAEWDETVPQQYSNNEAGWGKEVPNQCNSEFEQGEGSSKSKSNAVASKSNPSSIGVESAHSKHMPQSKGVTWHGITIQPTGWDE